MYSISTEPLHSVALSMGPDIVRGTCSFCCCCLVAKSCLTLCDPMDYTHRAPLSMGFPRQEYCEREAKVKVAQSCPTLCDPMDCIVHGILQARKLEWVVSPLFQEIFPTQGLNPGLPHCRWILYQLSHQGSPEYCNRLSFPSPGDLPNPGTEPPSSAWQADSLPWSHLGNLCFYYHAIKFA